MLKIALFVLIFGAVTLIFTQITPFILKLLEKWHAKKVTETSDKLDNAFVSIPKKKILYFYLLSIVACAILGFFLLKGNIIGIVSGIAVGVLLPQVATRVYAMQRKKKFDNQLVDGLMILSGSLKAGLSLMQAFEALAEEMPAPMSQEFNLLIRENRMGVGIEECLQHLRKRMRSDDMDLIVTAILVARETGGDLTTTFRQLVFTIRERDKLMGKVKALTVQGRMQGLVMSLLPVAFAGFAFKTNPHFFDIMLKDKTGQFLIGYAIVSYIIGIFLIKVFSKVEV